MTGDADSVRIIPLGGLGEVGKNMTLFEYGDDIIIVDVGLGFPTYDMYGIDLVLPDISYLRGKQHRIKGIFITHGHEDHIGGLPYLLPELGNPPIYGTRLTIGLISVRLKERRLVEGASLNVITPESVVRAGAFQVEFFRVSHSIPDAVGLAITTPAGLIVHTGDFKFDQTPIDGKPTDFGRLAEIGRRGVIALLSDCVHAETPGLTPSEQVVSQTLDNLFRECDGRVIVATFASLISRIQQVLDTAYLYGRKVAVVGRSMENNVTIARNLGFLDVPENTLVKMDDALRLPPSQVCFIITGAQGEPMAVLSRLAKGEHKSLVLQKGDTVILAASPIPGNETAIGRIINSLWRQGVSVIYNSLQQIHVSGHGSQEELKLMLHMIKPRYAIPVHGEPRHLAMYSRLAQDVGWQPDHIFILENGSVVEVGPHGGGITGTVPAGPVYVDGSTVGDVGTVVIKDRQILARDGILTVVLILNGETGLPLAGPDVASRGFVNMREAGELIAYLKEQLRQESLRPNAIELFLADPAAHSRHIKDFVGDLLYSQTKRRPVVVPLIIEM